LAKGYDWDMDEATINEQRRLVTFEQIAGYTVGWLWRKTPELAPAA
jgi:hypothetical protein